jgi:hypothetical protein
MTRRGGLISHRTNDALLPYEKMNNFPHLFWPRWVSHGKMNCFGLIVRCSLRTTGISYPRICPKRLLDCHMSHERNDTCYVSSVVPLYAWCRQQLGFTENDWTVYGGMVEWKRSYLLRCATILCELLCKAMLFKRQCCVVWSRLK